MDIEYLYLMKMLKVSENLTLKTKKSLKDEIETFTINPAFLALDEATYEEINEQVQNVSSDAFIKDIHSFLGFWYLNDLGEYLPQKFKLIYHSRST